MMEARRPYRVGEMIRGVVSDLLLRGCFRDPRLKSMITITKVDVTPDLKLARVHVSILEDKEKRQKVLKALQHATGFIKSNIGSQLDLRFIPNIEFKLDESLDYLERINQLLKVGKE